MARLILEQAITSAKLWLTHKNIYWRFNDDRHNPVMPTKLRNAPLLAVYSSDALVLVNQASGQEWRVAIDQQGRVLRANGHPYLHKDKPVKVLDRQGEREKINLSFWDLVFQRDRAPLEGRQSIGLAEFNRALKVFLENGNSLFLRLFTVATVGQFGQVVFGADSTQLIWGSSLVYHYQNRKVTLVPLPLAGEFCLGVYDPRSRSHIYTFDFDRTSSRFYWPRAFQGEIYRHYFFSVTPERQFSYRDLTFNLYEKAVVGKPMILEDHGDKIRIRACDQHPALPMYPLEKGGQVFGYLVGNTSLSRPTAISGKIHKGIPFFRNKAEGGFRYLISGRTYSFTETDAQILKVSLGDLIFVALEAGQVVEISSPNNPEGRVYNRLIRDENWQLLWARRGSLPASFLSDRIRIIEGLETSRILDREGVKIVEFLRFKNKVDQQYQPKPISVVVKFEGKLPRLLYASFAPRFSPPERERINQLLLWHLERPTLTDFRSRCQERRITLAKILAPILNHGFAPLYQRLTELQNLFAQSNISAVDLVNLLDMINELALRDSGYSHNSYLEVFTHLPQVLANLPSENQSKVRLALSLIKKYPELDAIFQTIGRNSLAKQIAALPEEYLSELSFDQPEPEIIPNSSR